MVIEKFQNYTPSRVYAFSALDRAIEKFLLDYNQDVEGMTEDFDVVRALAQLKADLRVICYPDGGTEHIDWLDSAEAASLS